MVRYKNEIIYIIIVCFLVLVSRTMSIFRVGSVFDHPIILMSVILLIIIISIFIQRNIDFNYKKYKPNYNNLDILRYICAILIIILHLRPFFHYSKQLDLIFNNIITRICVPVFFLVSGYFIAMKEKSDPNYIKNYIKKTIPMYLVWSIIYIPITMMEVVRYIPKIINYLPSNLPFYILIMFIPIVVIIALLYTGVYYHLWYFPALLLSLFILDKWKKKFNVKVLLFIAFILLLFGATETYYGAFSLNIQQLLTYYYKIFFTTRNFLFFGLFYVVFGYYIGLKQKIYSKFCFEKLVISFLCLIIETMFLQKIHRMNSNILLSCIPLTYYLVISTMYLFSKKNKNDSSNLRELYKYYYLVHPAIIFIYSQIIKCFALNQGVYVQILIVLIFTHLFSILIIFLKKRYKNLII